MKNVYSNFEFDQIKKQIRTYANTVLGKEYIDTLNMIPYKEDLKDELFLLDECILYAFKYCPINIFPLHDILDELEYIQKDGVGKIEFFYQVKCILETSKNIKESSIKDENFPLLMENLQKLLTHDQLAKTIDRIITRDLCISDDASDALRSIRRSIINEENSQTKLLSSLMHKYKSFLNDERVALKNEALTLPIKSTYKNKIDGLVIDVSDTGMTTFMTPIEIITSNNKIALLKEKEIEEINRILKELSLEVAKNYTLIKSDLTLLSRLDFVFAKAQYAIDNNHLVAKIVDEPKIYFKGAKHPLIDPNKVVKNDFILDKQKIMLITGPNAGGKTVALKVVGLLIVMSQCGLAIPTDEVGEFSFFDKIFIDIGDSQSLLDNLSTFSGHIENLKSIVDEVNSRSLVLIDELGTGTSPLDGEALGIGLLSFLKDTGCFALISSHYEGLKSFALENDFILNASMIFDEEKLLPTYRLRLGVAGKSYGVELARRLGLSKKVLSVAQDYIEKKKDTDTELKLSILQSQLDEVDILKREIEIQRKTIEEEKLSLEQEKNKLKALQNKTYLEAEEIKEELVKEAKSQIDKMVLEFQKAGSYKMPEIIKAKHNVSQVLTSYNEEEVENRVIQIGDYVQVENAGIRGKVISIKGENVTLLTDRNMSVNAKKSNLTKLIQPKKSKAKIHVNEFKSMTKMVSLELNVIGKRVEEALKDVEKYLDDAIVVHYKQVRIIHGAGTGALRAAIHEYLNRNSFVQSFRLGGLNEGGVGATVVTLK